MLEEGIIDEIGKTADKANRVMHKSPTDASGAYEILYESRGLIVQVPVFVISDFTSLLSWLTAPKIVVIKFLVDDSSMVSVTERSKTPAAFSTALIVAKSFVLRENRLRSFTTT